MTESEAEKHCQSLDFRAHLVEIRTKEIQSFIENQKGIAGHAWWIGASDEEKVLEHSKICLLISD